MGTTARLLALVPMVAALGCDPDPAKVELLAYDEATDAYAFEAVTLETIEDIGEMTGRATSIIGAAEFTYDLRTGVMKWDEPGRPVAFAAVEVDGVLVPEDFDSLAMASIYYGIELSLLFYERIGMPRDLLVHLDTYYWPRFKTIYTDGETEIVTDNAYYMYLSKKQRAFFVFPFEQFEWIPMSMNSGIMTHEFSHAVFDELVDEPNRDLFAQMTPSSRNFLYGLNEGWADFMAASRTGDPDFMSHTSPKGIFGIQCNSASWIELIRDVSIVYYYSSMVDNAARTVPVEDFCPYDVGLFFASTMYGVARAIDGHLHNELEYTPTRDSQERVARWLYATMGGLGKSLPIDFELWDVFGEMAAQAATDEERSLLCGVLSQRYALYFDQVEGC